MAENTETSRNEIQGNEIQGSEIDGNEIQGNELAGKAISPDEAPRPAGFSLSITRTFDAPASLVFQIWREREHMQQWLGPSGFRCTSLTLDFRPGGAWRGCIESEQYGASWMGGVYREIVPDERLVFTFAWEDERDQPGVQTLVTVTFSERNGKTTQTFQQAPFVHEAARDSHIDGWNECFDRQQRYAEGLARRGARS